MPARTVEIAFLGSTAELERALTRAGLTAEATGAKIGESFSRGTTKAGGAISKLGALGASWGVPFSRSLEGVGHQLDVATSKTQKFSTVLAAAGKMTLGAGIVGFAAAAYEGVKGAAALQKQMEMIHTQAGATQAQVGSLTKSILNMAGSVGTGPQDLAAGMYHVVSSLNATLPAASRAATELKVLHVAAMGAKVGGANLVDVTNALDAAIVSGIPGVQNYRQAMGALNAVIGAGDMSMQDLADALGTGILAPMKTYGLSLKDVGAALAVFGDNNIRGAEAATKLTSAVRIMAAPSAAASKALALVHLSTLQLANDMRSGGLIKALSDLRQHLKDSGATASQQGLIIARAFGGRQSQGVQVLLQQLDRLKAKYGEVGQGANREAQAEAATRHTLAFQFDQLKATIQSLADKFGGYLIPKLQAVGSAIASVVSWLGKHTAAAKALEAIIVGALGAALGAYAGARAKAFITATEGMRVAMGKFAQGVAAAAASVIAKFRGESIAAASSAGSIEASNAAVSTSMGSTAAATTTSGTAMKVSMGTTAAAVQVADDSMVVANEALGVSFSALLGPIGAAIAILVTFQDQISSAMNSILSFVQATPGGSHGGFSAPGQQTSAPGNFQVPGLAALNAGLPSTGVTQIPGLGVLTPAAKGATHTVTVGGKKFTLPASFTGGGGGTTGAGGSTAGISTAHLTAKGQPLDALQRAYASRIIAIGKSTGASSTAIAAVITEAIAESDLGHDMGWNSSNPTYGGLLAGSTSNFAGLGSSSSNAVTSAEIMAALRGGRGYVSGGAMGLARTSSDLLQIAMTNSGSGTQFLGQAGHGAYAGEARSILAGLAGTSGAAGKGVAAATSTIPAAVATMLATAQALVGTKYVWGGGHGSSFDPVSTLKKIGVDCSGFVSAVLHSGGFLGSSPVTTARLPGQLASGKGDLVTVWDRAAGSQAHTIIDIMGKWFEAGGNSRFNPSGGVSQMTAQQAAGELAGGGFNPYHPIFKGGPLASNSQLAALGISGTTAGTASTTQNIGQLIAAYIKKMDAALSKAGGSVEKSLASAIQNGSVKGLEGVLGVSTSAKVLGINANTGKGSFRPLSGWLDRIFNSKVLTPGARSADAQKFLTEGLAGSAQGKAFDGLIASLNATHNKKLEALARSLEAAHKAALKALASELFAAHENALARFLTLQATGIKDQTTLIANMASNVVTAMKDAAQTVADTFSNAATAVKDQSQASSNASQATVQQIQDQSQITTDTLAERGLYGLNLVAQQQQVTLDQMKMGFDQQQAGAQASLDSVTAATNKVIGAAQINVDSVTTTEDALVGAAQTQLDRVTSFWNTGMQKAQNAVDKAATGTKAQQDSAAANLTLVTAQGSVAVANAQSAYQAAQNTASSVIQQANTALANAQATASLQLANASAALTTVQDQANVAEAQQQAIVQKTQAQASTQFAGSGITINLEGINPTDGAAVASEIGWKLRTLIPV